MVVMRHPALELLVERVGGGLTNSDNGCADLGETAHKVALGRWKEGLDEYDVHGGMLPVLCGLSLSKPAPFDGLRAQFGGSSNSSLG